MKRDEKIDSVKFFLLFVVVLGHCIEPFVEKPMVQGLYNFVFLFHMPLFVFLSGYFTKKKPLLSQEFLVGEIRILETYLVFDLLHRLPSFGDGSFAIRAFLSPSWTMWYLLSLLFWRFFIQFLLLICENVKILLGVSIALGLLIGFVPISGTLSIQRTFSFFPFFVMGFFISKNGYINKIRMINHLIPSLICIFFFVVCFFLLDCDIHTILWGKFPYIKSGYSVEMAFSLRFLFYIVAFLLSFSILNIFSFNSDFMSREGRKSLFYYLYHSFLLTSLFGFIKYCNISVNILNLVLFAFLVMVVLYGISKLKLFNWLLNPISTFLMRKHN